MSCLVSYTLRCCTFYLHPVNSTMCSLYNSSLFGNCAQITSRTMVIWHTIMYHLSTFVHITNFVEIRKPFMDRRTDIKTAIIRSTLRNSTKMNTLKLTYNTTWNIVLAPETVQFTDMIIHLYTVTTGINHTGIKNINSILSSLWKFKL